MAFYIFSWILYLYITVAESIAYLDWDGTPKTESATKFTTDTTLTSGWHYVEGQVSREGFQIEDGVVANLILTDNSELKVNGGIRDSYSLFGKGTTELTIYGQSKGNGKLTIIPPGFNYAGISVNTLTINGGEIAAEGGHLSAGIGGSANFGGRTVIINAGLVRATGGDSAAGIGGANRNRGGPVTINGGVIIAQGGIGPSAGIGGGNEGYGGDVVITGGSVKALHGDSTYGGYYPDNPGDDIGGGATSSNHGTLTDGAGNNVYLNTIRLPTDAATADAPVTDAVIGNVSSYGLRGVRTDDNSTVYFYLPASVDEEEVKLTVGGKVYEGKYTRHANHNNDEVLVLTCADRTPDGSGALQCGSACFLDTDNSCTKSCSDPDYDEDASTGNCTAPPEPEPEPEPESEADAAAMAKRSLALAVIVAVIVWLI